MASETSSADIKVSSGVDTASQLPGGAETASAPAQQAASVPEAVSTMSSASGAADEEVKNKAKRPLAEGACSTEEGRPGAEAGPGSPQQPASAQEAAQGSPLKKLATATNTTHDVKLRRSPAHSCDVTAAAGEPQAQQPAVTAVSGSGVAGSQSDTATALRGRVAQQRHVSQTCRPA